MGLLLFVLLLGLPVAELYVIVQSARAFGVLETLAALVIVSVAGAYLLKQQGLKTWRSLRATLQRGEVPAREAVDGALILLGGALLLTPGFITDALGLVLLLPPSRAALKGTARRVMARWARRRLVVVERGARVYEATIRRRETAPTDEQPGLRPGGDGSPGRG
jgi:UPF0716 protein FxsA